MDKKITLILSTLTLLTTMLVTRSFTQTSAEPNQVSYSNKAYQICDVQDRVKNYFMYDSIYSYTKSRIHLKNSLRMKNIEGQRLCMLLEFTDDITYIASQGYLHMCFKDDNNNQISYLNRSIYDDQDLDEPQEGYSFFLNENSLFAIIETENFPNYFTLCGDEYFDEEKSFFINLGKDTNALVSRFMLFMSDNPYDYTYSAPELGKITSSSKIYNNGDSYSFKVDYDNRPSVDKILDNIIAYDYVDKKELVKLVENDTYSEALNRNELGTYSIDVYAIDSKNNRTTITLNIEIVDITSPVINGETNIKIPYNEMPEDGIIDLTKYLKGIDNHDGIIPLDISTYTPEFFKNNALKVTSTDSSGNVGEALINIEVYDNIAPTIEGEHELDYYQFELSNIDEILEEYSYSDGDGVGVEEVGIVDSYINSYLGKVGTYPVTIFCQDKYGNESYFEVNINIKDGIGPVFFIDEISLDISFEQQLSAEKIIAKAISQNKIDLDDYEKCAFVDDNYSSNYNKEGTYETKIVVYKNNHQKAFYQFKINVTKEEKNVFVRAWNSIKEFFIRIGSFFEYICHLAMKK